MTLCRGTSPRDEVEYADVAVDAVCDHEDKAVLAVVESCNAGTSYDPPLEVDPVVLPPVRDDVEAAETDFAPPGYLSPASSDATIDPPDDFTVDGSLAAQSVPRRMPLWLTLAQKRPLIWGPVSLIRMMN